MRPAPPSRPEKRRGRREPIAAWRPPRRCRTAAPGKAAAPGAVPPSDTGSSRKRASPAPAARHRPRVPLRSSSWRWVPPPAAPLRSAGLPTFRHPSPCEYSNMLSADILVRCRGFAANAAHCPGRWRTGTGFRGPPPPDKPKTPDGVMRIARKAGRSRLVSSPRRRQDTATRLSRPRKPPPGRTPA